MEAQRLSPDATRSPTMEAAPISAPKIAANQAGMSWPESATGKQAATAAEPAMPKNAPSHVFFGLSAGANGRRPRNRPPKYAKMSEDLEIATTT